MKLFQAELQQIFVVKCLHLHVNNTVVLFSVDFM